MPGWGLFFRLSRVLGRVFVCDAGSVCFCCRWHPRGAFAAQALPLCGAACAFGLSCDTRVVVMGLRWHPRDDLTPSRVAPVRGGTYFLCRRKESKQRKRANTVSPCSRLRAPKGSYPSNDTTTFHYPLPTHRINASPASITRSPADDSEWFAPPRWQTVCRS